MTTKLNINDRVTVALTLDGEIAWRRYWEQYGGAMPPSAQVQSGHITTELWTLMAAFGPHLYMGGPQLFVDNQIEIKG